MDAHLDTLFTKLYQVNTHVGCIARQQACLGGFMESPSPPLKGLEVSKDDDDSDDDDDGEDGDANSSPMYMATLISKLHSIFVTSDKG